MPFFVQHLLSCLGREEGSLKLVDNDTKPDCVFCDVSPSRGFDVLEKTSTLVIFRDRDPAAKEHLLVTPVKHIRSVKHLRREDILLLQDMEEAGHRALDHLNISRGSRRMGFHIPPFNSVMHLHLHVQSLPYKSAYRRVQLPISEATLPKFKGFSWFVELGQAISILERDGKIGVFPC